MNDAIRGFLATIVAIFVFVPSASLAQYCENQFGEQIECESTATKAEAASTATTATPSKTSAVKGADYIGSWRGVWRSDNGYSGSLKVIFRAGPTSDTYYMNALLGDAVVPGFGAKAKFDGKKMVIKASSRAPIDIDIELDGNRMAAEYYAYRRGGWGAWELEREDKPEATAITKSVPARSPLPRTMVGGIVHPTGLLAG